ncbi:hypothetical protein ACTXT7_014690 [Hymenolepis weldensis]
MRKQQKSGLEDYAHSNRMLTIKLGAAKASSQIHITTNPNVPKVKIRKEDKMSNNLRMQGKHCPLMICLPQFEQKVPRQTKDIQDI